MRKVLEGIKAGFHASTDIERVINPQDRVTELVALMEKHHAADQVAGSFQSAVRNFVGTVVGGVDGSRQSNQSPSSRVVSAIMEELMTQGQRGQKAVLDFCDKQGKFQEALRIISEGLSAAGQRPISGLKGSSADLARSDAGFPSFVEHVIAGNERSSPLDNVAGKIDREASYDRLRNLISEYSRPESGLTNKM